MLELFYETCVLTNSRLQSVPNLLKQKVICNIKPFLLLLQYYTKVAANWVRKIFFQKLQIQKKAFSAFRSVSGGWFEQYVSQIKDLRLCSPKQCFRVILRQRCAENMKDIYRRTSMPNCDFNKAAGDHLCQGAISIKVLCNFTGIALWYGCSPRNLLHIFTTLFPRNNSGGLPLCSLSNATFRI